MGCRCGSSASNPVVAYRLALPDGVTGPHGEEQLDYLHVSDARRARSVYGGGVITPIRKVPA